MRSIRLLAAVSGILVLGSACGGDGGGTGTNTPPVANFTAACTGRVCAFDDTSTDDNGISSRTWTFDDPDSGGLNSSSEENPDHTFTADGTYSVSLTVTDADGETSTKTNDVPVSNGAPTANFTSSCNGAVCTFTSTSTDPDGSIASSVWDFGEPASGGNNSATTAVASHSYTVTTPNTAFTVSLTVTDNQGTTATKTQAITLSPPAGLVCDGVACTLLLTSKSTVTVTVNSSDCQFVGNAFAITSPIQETVFTDGCHVTGGTQFLLNGGNPFDANTPLAGQFTQGNGTPGDPPKGPPATRVTGDFPDWVIELDDGGNPTGVGEPDFNDIVLAVHATIVP